MAERPLLVRDLRVAGFVGPRVQRALEDACRWVPLDDSADRSDLIDARPHLVLLESPNPHDSPVERMSEIVGHAREAGARSALWLTDFARVDAFPSGLVSEVEVVCSSDPGIGAKLKLAALGARYVVGLPHAASRSALLAEKPEPEPRVGFVVEPSTSWDEQFPKRVEPILEEARESGLSVLALEPRAPGVPPGLAQAAERGVGEDDRTAFIRRCGALVAASPPSTSAWHTPPVAFDAVAIGVPVIVPRGSSGAFTLPRMLGLAESRQVARQRISAALEHGELAPGRREAGRAGVRNEHTYPHRLATVASALSMPVMPEVPPG